MIPLKDQVQEAVDFLKHRVKIQPVHALFLGTGLKDLIHKFNIQAKIPVSAIPYFPQMTVDHMDTSLYVAEHQGALLWILGGRLHYYEGHTMEEVTFPVRLLAAADTCSFFFTNAAGNVNPDFSAADLILISDHINWSFPSPLRGKNHSDWGARYPEMIDIYSTEINQQLINYALRSDIQLDTGVYLGLTGPQLETPAEYRLFHRLGADMVGMSTIPEVIVAAHMGCHITALSVLSNDAVKKPEKGSTDIVEIISHINQRKEDVANLIQHWLTL